MKFRKTVMCSAAVLALSIAVGCSSNDDKPPKAETTPGAKKLQPKTPGGGGPAPRCHPG